MAVACTVCGGRSAPIVPLPNLPLTGLYLQGDSPAPAIGAADQELLACEDCGHAQLANVLSPGILYGNEYGFRTSASHCARAGNESFVAFLSQVAGDRRFRHAVDIGCNDLHLLRLLADRAEARTGIDPVWEGQPAPQGEAVHVIGATVEQVDLTALPGGPVDLVVCSHTLEHVEDPRAVLRQVLASLAPDALLVFEVPGFDWLVSRLRFDQVHHHHLQYFSCASLFRLLAEVGAEYLDHRVDAHKWGSIQVAFRRGSGAAPVAPRQHPGEVARRYELFRRLAAETRAVLDGAPGPLLGFGAAQLLPNLAYHLGGLGAIEVILDDDPDKDGWRYPDLPLTIRHPGGVPGWRDGSVAVTALDNAAPILRRLLDDRPRNILLPLLYV